MDPNTADVKFLLGPNNAIEKFFPPQQKKKRSEVAKRREEIRSRLANPAERLPRHSSRGRNGKRQRELLGAVC